MMNLVVICAQVFESCPGDDLIGSLAHLCPPK
jgi:hypothetical protein